MRVLLGALWLGGLTVAGCSTPESGDAETGGSSETGAHSTNPFIDYESEQYGGLDNWLCHPELALADDTCRQPIDTTVVQADGSTSVETHTQASEPAFDCFYVYPTVSADTMANSDLEPDQEERFTTLNQAARYTSVCRTFAPVYRQVTLGALFNPMLNPDRELAYGDVEDAFKQYVANNDGRGFLLVGHSQGTFHLRELIANVVEGDAYLEAHFIGAHLMGGTVEVPPGEDVGGSFATIPLCRAQAQVGCVVSYASFRADDPPDPATTRFGLAETPGMVAGCTHPASLMGGAADLDGYYPSAYEGLLDTILGDGPGPFADPSAHDPIATPFYKTPGLVRGECVERDSVSYLEISVNADPSDPRADEIGGDFSEGWGLHLADVSMAMGDLVAMAQAQGAAWVAAR